MKGVSVILLNKLNIFKQIKEILFLKKVSDNIVDLFILSKDSEWLTK